MCHFLTTLTKIHKRFRDKVQRGARTQNAPAALTEKKPGRVIYFIFFFKSNLKVVGDLRESTATHQLIENGYIVGVGEKRSIALRSCGERRSVHSGEDVGERAGRTELCPGSRIAGDPLALRRVYRSDVLISQLRERHGGRKRAKKSAAITQSKGIASISTFTV